MLKDVKIPNYSEEQVESLTNAYESDPSRDNIEAWAKENGKGYRSVISKLSHMKIYKAPVRTTKSGTPIVKKEVLVQAISDAFSIEIPSLLKTNKQDLERLLGAIRGVSNV